MIPLDKKCIEYEKKFNRMAHQSIDQMLGKVLYIGLEHDLLFYMKHVA